MQQSWCSLGLLLSFSASSSFHFSCIFYVPTAKFTWPLTFSFAFFSCQFLMQFLFVFFDVAVSRCKINCHLGNHNGNARQQFEGVSKSVRGRGVTCLSLPEWCFNGLSICLLKPRVSAGKRKQNSDGERQGVGKKREKDRSLSEGDRVCANVMQNI